MSIFPSTIFNWINIYMHMSHTKLSHLVFKTFFLLYELYKGALIISSVSKTSLYIVCLMATQAIIWMKHFDIFKGLFKHFSHNICIMQIILKYLPTFGLCQCLNIIHTHICINAFLANVYYYAYVDTDISFYHSINLFFGAFFLMDFDH